MDESICLNKESCCVRHQKAKLRTKFVTCQGESCSASQTLTKIVQCSLLGHPAKCWLDQHETGKLVRVLWPELLILQDPNSRHLKLTVPFIEKKKKKSPRMSGVPVLVHLSAKCESLKQVSILLLYKPFSAYFVPCFCCYYNTPVVIIIVVFHPFSPYNTKYGNVVPTRNWT